MWESLPAGSFRHPDHRFEWTRAEFAAWAERVAAGTATRVALPRRSGPEDPEASARRRRWRCSSDEDRASRPVPGRAHRRLRLGQEHVRGARTSCPPRSISSDFCRALVADDPNDQAATEDAFAVLHEIAARRLARGRLTVIDATNVQQRGARAARAARPRARPVRGRDRARHARGGLPGAQRRARRTATSARTSSAASAGRCGARCATCSARASATSYVAASRDEVDAVEIVRAPLWTDRRAEHGPVRHHRRRPRLLRRAA